MPSAPPFVDPATGKLDTNQILAEAVPLARLVAVFVAVALVPLALVFVGLGNSVAGAVLVVIAQFVLAVGGGIVLMYVIARGVQLSGSGTLGGDRPGAEGGGVTSESAER